MNTIESWLEGAAFRSLRIGTVLATLVSRCNLACRHCYWAHDMRFQSSGDWDQVHELLRGDLRGTSLVYAGRILNPVGVRFLRRYVEETGHRPAIIDNGWTVTAWPELLSLYEQISISIDGWRDAHDWQRGKEGAFDRSWSAVLSLKERGFDPVISSALSPATLRDWDKFEELCSENDVPMSATLVWDLPETGSDTILGDEAARRAFDLLVGGVPKLVNLYSQEHVRALGSRLRDLPWRAVEDRLTAELPNGVVVVYRPPSIVAVTEVDILWDGEVKTSLASGVQIPLGEVGESYFRRVAQLQCGELELWRQITQKGGG